MSTVYVSSVFQLRERSSDPVTSWMFTSVSGATEQLAPHSTSRLSRNNCVQAAMNSIGPRFDATTACRSNRTLLGWKVTTCSPIVVGPVGRGHRAPYWPHVRRQADWEVLVMSEMPLLEEYGWETGYSDLMHLPNLQVQVHCQLRRRKQNIPLVEVNTKYYAVLTGKIVKRVQSRVDY